MRCYANILRCGFAAVMATGMCGLRASWAQEETEDLFGPAATQLPFDEPGRGGYGVGGYGGGYGDSGDPGGAYGPGGMGYGGYDWGMIGDPAADRHRKHLTQALGKAAEALRAATGEEAKAKATAQLTEAFDKYFENDMTRRATELARIEERVKKLRAQLEKRAAKKQEIIDLQIKVLENEADGLGLFSQPPNPAQRDPLPRPSAVRPQRALLPTPVPVRPSDSVPQSETPAN